MRSELSLLKNNAAKTLDTPRVAKCPRCDYPLKLISATKYANAVLNPGAFVRAHLA